MKQPHITFEFGLNGRQSKVTLPPIADWSGASERFIANSDDPWATRAEQSDFRETADFPATIDWLERLAKSWDCLQLETIGKSAGQRDIKLAIVSRHGHEPAQVHSAGKAVILIQAGIHSGEIDGKDAMMMILRDLAQGRTEDLLEEAVILFIPILNVDGFARFGPYNRINQRGPLNVGWHTNDRNLNLNRDFGKLDAPETRAVIGLINKWQPDLYIDTHVTDGADYQYDVTFGHTGGPHAWSPTIAGWIDEHLMPAAHKSLTEEGHVPGPLTLAANDRDMRDGRFAFTANARFSTGGADLHHLPAILIENHSLKTFRQRVLGMYVLLKTLIKSTADNVASLRKAVKADKARRPNPLALGWTVDTESTPKPAPFKGIRSAREFSQVSGEEIAVWSSQPDETPVAVVAMNKPSAQAVRPKAYYIPPHLDDIVQRLRHHGIRLDRLEVETTSRLTRLRLPDARVTGGSQETGIVGASSTQVLEGRIRVSPGTPVPENMTHSLRPGFWRLQTDQPLGDLAMVLLEPTSPDSFFQWGFILSIFENAAYSEPYVTDPLAQQMLTAEPALDTEFQKKLAEDDAFANNPDVRRNWFLSQTPYSDPNYRLYPILREEL